MINDQPLESLVAEGWRIVESDLLVRPALGRRRRSWVERLLSVPWEPGRTHEFFVHYRPSHECIICPGFQGGPAIIAHPSVAQQLRKKAADLITYQWRDA